MLLINHNQKENNTMRSNQGIVRALFILFAVIGAAVLHSAPAYAHCDGMDGPVVKAAQEALAKGDVNLVLIWVHKNDEAEIRKSFDRTMSVRKLSPQARELQTHIFSRRLSASIAPVRVHLTLG